MPKTFHIFIRSMDILFFHKGGEDDLFKKKKTTKMIMLLGLPVMKLELKIIYLHPNLLKKHI